MIECCDLFLKKINFNSKIEKYTCITTFFEFNDHFFE